MKYGVFIVLISISSFAAPKQSETVAQVGGLVITSREIKVLYLIDQVLEAPNPSAAQEFKKLEIPEENSEPYKKNISQVVLDGVLSLEAENFSVGQVTSEEIRAKESQIQTALKENSRWKAMDIQEVELQTFLQRRLKAKVFLKYKSDTSLVTVSDEEAKVYYDKNLVKFGNAPFAQFKDQIKQKLSEAEIQEKLRDWFEILKRKYKVKYLGNTGQPK